jgi:hypothetical protein
LRADGLPHLRAVRALAHARNCRPRRRKLPAKAVIQPRQRGQEVAKRLAHAGIQPRRVVVLQEIELAAFVRKILPVADLDLAASHDLEHVVDVALHRPKRPEFNRKRRRVVFRSGMARHRPRQEQNGAKAGADQSGAATSASQ